MNRNSDKLKVLIVGSWRWPQYEQAFAKGMQEHGVNVIALRTAPFFTGSTGRLQLKIPFLGPAMMRHNRQIIEVADAQRPDWILFWRPTHILPGTLRRLKTLGLCLASYNNDDPFGPQAHGNVPWHHHLLWHWYIKCLPTFDRNFFYRRVNCDEALAKGARRADVMLPYFIPKKDRPVELNSSEKAKYGADVTFVGHYEPDGREKSIRALIGASVKLKIWGGHYWSRKVLGDLYGRLQPIVPAEGDDYAKALCGAKICLAFLSKLNRDTYTRRCFEIPACGRLMLAERTSDLTQMFKEDEEACFFSSDEELVQKVRWLLENPKERERIAEAGMRRVWADGHDVESRAEQFINNLQL